MSPSNPAGHTPFLRRDFVFAIAFLGSAAATASAQPTHQQQQYYIHQQQQEAQRRQQAEAQRRSQQNFQDTLRLQEQQRRQLQANQALLDQDAAARARQQREEQERRSKVQLAGTSNNEAVGGAASSSIPAPIDARHEQDPEKIVAYIAAWVHHIQFFANGSVKVQSMGLEQGDWKTAAVHGIVADGCTVLQDEFKLLVTAERLAALATTPAEKRQAAILLHRTYANFDEHIIQAAQDYWRGSIAEIRLALPDVADMLQQQLADPMDRLNKEFIKPRTEYWQAQL